MKFLSCVLCWAMLALPVHAQTFQKVRYLQDIGGKTREIKAHLVVADESIQVRMEKSQQVLQEIPYTDIKSVTYSRSKHRRWKSGIGAAVVGGVLAAPLFFMKGKKHWLTVEAGEDQLGLRLDKNNYDVILDALEDKSGLDVEMIIEE